MKVLIVHPTGNQNSRWLAKGLAAAGNDVTFATSIACPKWILPYAKIFGVRNFVQRRVFEIPGVRTKSLARIKEITRILVGRLSHKFSRTASNDIDEIYRRVDLAAAKLVRQRRDYDLVYCYEDGAEATFAAAKEIGAICVYELPIAYWRLHQKIFDAEASLSGDWRPTWRVNQESEEKLRRKDRELVAAEKILVASTFTLDSLLLHPSADTLASIGVIPYGFPSVTIEASELLDSEAEELKVLYVGGINERKGMSLLGPAMEKLEKAGISASLSIIGAGSGESLLPRLIPSAKFLGNMSHQEVLQRMRDHHILLLPSRFEGFGLVISEAMANGMVVIASNRTALQDISNSESSILMSSLDSDSIFDGVSRLWQNRQLLRKMRHQAMCVASRYSWDDYGSRMNDVLTELLG